MIRELKESSHVRVVLKSPDNIDGLKRTLRMMKDSGAPQPEVVCNFPASDQIKIKIALTVLKIYA